MSLNKRSLTVICFLFIFLIPAFSAEDNYIPINTLISEKDLKVEYKENSGTIILKKENKSALIILDADFILAGGKKIFIEDFIKSENGQYMLPKKAYLALYNYFEGKVIISEKKTTTQTDKRKEYFLDNVNEKKTVKNDPKSKKDNDKVVKADELPSDSQDNKSDEVNVKDKYIYKKAPKKMNINAIIIDPGHGGEDPGAVGLSGTKEKDVVLKVSLLLFDTLKKNFPDKKIILTRDDDSFISLDKRASIANYIFNKYGTSLFVSVHVNASRSGKSYGFETWYLVEEYRRNIVKKGNLSNDADVEKVINSMLNDEIYKESKDLAGKIQLQLNKLIGNVSEDRGIKEQTYFVIKKSLMPAVLVEIGFNTNKFEEIRLTRYAYLNKIATGIFYGIKEFIEEYENTSGFTK